MAKTTNQDSQGVREAAAEWIGLEKLVGWDSNPRRNADAVARVARSIKRFGFGAPVTAFQRSDGAIEIIAGHTRVKAARKVGLSEVPVRLLALPPDEAHKLAVADNKLQELAAWDKALLGPMLGEWQDDGEDLSDLGFNDAEIRQLVGQDDEVEVEELDVSQCRAEFWLTVTGPISSQPDVLDALRVALAKVPGVEVTVTTSEL